MIAGLFAGLMLLSGCSTTNQQAPKQGVAAVGSPESSRVVTEIDSASGAGELVIEGASYKEVFGAARDVLSAYRFGINRVDAARGVITTFPKRTAGLATLWDREQSSLDQELEDFANQQEREVRIVFERINSDMDADGEEASELSVVRAVVRVDVLRVHRPHRRVETESIRMSTYARSRDGQGRRGAAEFREAIGQDLDLARRVGEEIRGRFD